MLLRLEDALQWLQTPGLLPKIIAPSGLLDRHLQTIKADIRAVEANFAREFKASIDQTRVSIFVEAARIGIPIFPAASQRRVGLIGHSTIKATLNIGLRFR